MSRRTTDQMADELTDALDQYISDYWTDQTGPGITWTHGGQDHRVWVRSGVFRDLVSREYYLMTERGIKPAVLNQVIRNIEARALYGQRLRRVS